MGALPTLNIQERCCCCREKTTLVFFLLGVLLVFSDACYYWMVIFHAVFRSVCHLKCLILVAFKSIELCQEVDLASTTWVVVVANEVTSKVQAVMKSPDTLRNLFENRSGPLKVHLLGKTTFFKST